MKRYISIIVALFCIFHASSLTQGLNVSLGDSSAISEGYFLQEDTVKIDSLVYDTIKPKQDEFKADSKKATIYAAIFPGLGQIYNRKYWKLPLVYGGFIGCAYAISWNGSQYNGYRSAYKDFIDEDPATNSWEDYRYGAYRREDPANWTASMERDFANTLKTVRDFHRRNRDLSYIITVGVYAIWIVDAYVDAQLFDFDVSPDLSMRMAPVFFERTAYNSRSIGVQFSIVF